MSWYLRLILSVGVAIGAAVILALAITFVDLYLVGHSRPSLNRATIFVPGIDMPISLSDVMLISGTLFFGFVTWVLLGFLPKRDQDAGNDRRDAT